MSMMACICSSSLLKAIFEASFVIDLIVKGFRPSTRSLSESCYEGG